MPQTVPFKAATFLLRLTAEEKKRFHEMAKERNVSLSLAMREGAKLYFAEYDEKRRRSAPTHGRRFVE
jgi:hypothetical protein